MNSALYTIFHRLRKSFKICEKQLFRFKDHIKVNHVGHSPQIPKNSRSQQHSPVGSPSFAATQAAYPITEEAQETGVGSGHFSQPLAAISLSQQSVPFCKASCVQTAGHQRQTGTELLP